MSNTALKRDGEDDAGTSFPAFAAMGMMVSVWLGALWRASGSPALCMLLHTLVNTLLGVLALDPASPAYWLALAALTIVSLAAARFMAGGEGGGRAGVQRDC